MLFRILKRDLKRKKTMNVILFLFIVLAAMFVASGINNVVTVMNGTEYFFDKAGMGDYVIITMGEGAVGALDDMLQNESAVKSYRKECGVYGTIDNVKAKDGSVLKSNNTAFVFQSIDDLTINLFDDENEKITKIDKGHVIITGSFMKDNNLKEGDEIVIEICGVDLSLILDGTAKDALFGSDFMGNTRFLLNDEDIQVFLDNEEIYTHYTGEICYIDTDDVLAISRAESDASNIAFSGARSMLKMTYIMELIMAFIVLILSVCLIVVSMVVLKFTITFTISEEFREIGVMKAIGISNGRIRSLYITKYFMMALLGSVFGFFFSIPFGGLMLGMVSEKMVLGNENALFLNLIGALLVILVIILFAYNCTKKVKKATPVDAIRSGETDERYRKKSVLKLHKFPVGNSFFMALNDILSSPKRFLTIISVFTVFTLFVLMLVNTTNTMKSDKLISAFGVTKTDLYFVYTSGYMNLSDKEDMLETMNKFEEELSEAGMPAELCVDVQYNYPISFEGYDYMLACQQGVNTRASDYKYMEGSAPKNKNEIAITPQISEITGAKIGDTMTIHFGDTDLDCMVVAYYETMNILGEVVRLHEDAPVDFEFKSATLPYQIKFTDSPDEEVITERKERISEMYENSDVMTATEYCISCVAVADAVEGVQHGLLLVTIIVIILVTILMEKSFITSEKSEIAILKAMGFKDFTIIKWHVLRFFIVALIAVILAAALSTPMTDLCISPVFGMMGASEIDYNIKPLEIFLIYPGIVLAVTVFVSWLVSLGTRSIKSSDTADIE